MPIYKLNSFVEQSQAFGNSRTFTAKQKETEELYYIKPSTPNQLINLIIAYPLFREVLWRRYYS